MSPPSHALIWFLAAAAATAVAIALMRASGLMMHVLDEPNARSMHVRPTPRIGGLPLWAVAIILALAATDTGPMHEPAFIGPLLVLIATGALDDRHQLAATPRLLVQMACTVPMAWSWASRLGEGFALAAPMLVLIAIVLALAVSWAINLYNFMDGSDGIAGLMTVIGFGALALAAPTSGPIALSAACVAGAAAGFLVHNWPTARVFLGDAGSTALGFAAAALSLDGVVAGYWPIWFPGLVFLPFWLDATLTLVRRALAGQRLAQAHREHAYQRLALAGAGHLGTALAYGGLMLADAILALGLLHLNSAGFPSFEIAWIIVGNLMLYIAIPAPASSESE